MAGLAIWLGVLDTQVGYSRDLAFKVYSRVKDRRPSQRPRRGVAAATRVRRSQLFVGPDLPDPPGLCTPANLVGLCVVRAGAAAGAICNLTLLDLHAAACHPDRQPCESK
eukprot:COSAG01_NODE_10706_length_2099_cov_2.936000_3_plen_110_part_00